MATQTNLLAFMTEAPDGKYEAPKPTDEQLAAILPWLIDATITFARTHGYCAYVNEALPGIIGKLGGGMKITNFYNAAGFDCEGYDRTGYNADGFDRRGFDKDGYAINGRNRDGFNKDGFDRGGFNKDGFDKDGLNLNGKTRDQVVVDLVGGWTPEYLATAAVKLAERQAATAAKAAEEAAAAEAVRADTPAEELAAAAA